MGRRSKTEELRVMQFHLKQIERVLKSRFMFDHKTQEESLRALEKLNNTIVVEIARVN